MIEDKIIAKNEVDLTEILSVLWRSKWMIIIVTGLFAAGSVYYAKSLPNVYKATAVLAQVEESQGGMLSGLKSDLGGLAAMAGVNLGGGGSNKAELAIHVLTSRAFITEFVAKYDLKPQIMAAESWDIAQDQLLYDPKVFDVNTQKWLREVDLPLKPEPSAQEVFDKFISNQLDVLEEKKSGLVQVSVSHYSPTLAKKMVDDLVIEINNRMREDDVEDANKNIEYLKQSLASTSVADMQKIFFQLIEQQEQKKMLAQTQTQYVFKIIDPAIVPEQKDSPSRALICIGITMLGGILSILLSLFRFYVLRKK